MSAFPSQALLAWYALHGRRHLPWRGTRDPYRVLVSEAMLQQTQVERVIPLYEAFLARFPDLAALAAADAGDVVRAWRGLGYNSRALRLHALARAVRERHGGVLPSGEAELRALPGVGAYTAAALRAFAFDLDGAAADVNVRRVVQRVLYGLEFPAATGDAQLDAAAQRAVPAGAAHDWNSAMMDLGATICTARAPKCLVCPLRDDCAAAPVDPQLLRAHTLTRKQRKLPHSVVPFKQTGRFLRGRIVDCLRDVARGESLTLAALIDALRGVVASERLIEIPSVVDVLVRDGFIARDGDALRLS